MDLKIYTQDDSSEWDLQGEGHVIHDIVYADRSVRNNLDLYLPNVSRDRYPLVVFVHGGGFFKSDKSHHMSNILNVLPMEYAAASINYRLTQEDKAAYPEIRRDCIDALNCLAMNDHVDSSRIIVWGESHGALMVDDVVVNHADELDFWPAGVISMNAPINMDEYVDWKAEHGRTFYVNGKDNDAYIYGCDEEHMREEMRRNSILDKVSSNEPPFLLMHGELDEEIPVKYTHQFYGALVARGVPARLLVVPDGHHGIDNYMDPAHNEPVMRFIDDVFRGRRI